MEILVSAKINDVGFRVVSNGRFKFVFIVSGSTPLCGYKETCKTSDLRERCFI